MRYYFQKFAWIQNRNTAQKIKWLTWSYLTDLIDIINYFQEIVILKARQLGISWEIAGIGAHTVEFRDNARVVYFSQGETDAWELLSKSKFIHDNTPDYMKHNVTNESRGWLKLENKSEIKAMPSTEKAGRGIDATLVVRDELAFHPYGRENFYAVGAAVDSGGKAIDLSTINKFAGPDDASYHFTDRVIRTKEQCRQEKILPSGVRLFSNEETKKALVFLGWDLRPTRQEGMSLEQWFELKIKPKYTAIEIEQEYPKTLEEALKTPETTAFFERSALEDMLLSVMNPINTSEIDTRDGMIRIYKLPVVGKNYVLFSDPSDGIEDPFCSIVMDAMTGEGVATACGKIKADQCAKIHDTLARFYGATHSYDINATAGGKFDETIRTLDTPKLAARRTPDGKIQLEKRGYQINPQIREAMLDGVEEAVRKRLIIPYDREAINEMTTFSRIEGKAQAPKGMHDDWVMAWAGVWFMSKFVPRGELKITSGIYKG